MNCSKEPVAVKVCTRTFRERYDEALIQWVNDKDRSWVYFQEFASTVRVDGIYHKLLECLKTNHVLAHNDNQAGFVHIVAFRALLNTVFSDIY
jgi:hypothetical protein